MNNKKITNTCDICGKKLRYRTSRHCSECSNVYSRMVRRHPDKAYDDLLEVCIEYRRNGPAKVNYGRKPKYI